MLCLRPSLDARLNWTDMTSPYDRRIAAQADEQLLACADDLGKLDTYQFDVVNVTRNALAGLAQKFYQDAVVAFKAGDRDKLASSGQQLLDLIRDIDSLPGHTERVPARPVACRRQAMGEQRR